MTWDPEGPITALRDKGLTVKWLDIEFRREYNGKPQWNYRSKFLSTTAIRDLAHLVVDGWNVLIKPGGNNIVHIQIKEGEHR